MYKILLEKGKNKQAFLGLGKIHAFLKNTKQALSFTDSALVMDKHYRDAYMLKAMIFRNEGKFEQTVSSYQTAIEQDSKYIPAYVALGNVYANKENIGFIRVSVFAASTDRLLATHDDLLAISLRCRRLRSSRQLNRCSGIYRTRDWLLPMPSSESHTLPKLMYTPRDR